MPWFNVDDGFPFHHKTVRAGNAAVGLWTRAGAWCAQQLTDGFVPEHMVSVLGTPAQAKRLVAAGLWTVVEGGYQFHEWGGRNPSREEVLEKRRREAEKKAKAREVFAQKRGNAQVDEPSPQGTEAGLPLDVPKGVRSTTPLHSTPNKDSLRSSGSVNGGVVVKAWVDASRGNGVEPSKSQIGQVGKLAKELLAKNEPKLVVEAARAAGAKGFTSIDRELTAMVARGRTTQQGQRRDPKTGRAVDW